MAPSQLLVLGFLLVCALSPGRIRSTSASGQSTAQNAVSPTIHSLSPTSARPQLSLRRRAPEVVLSDNTIVCQNGYDSRERKRDDPDRTQYLSCTDIHSEEYWCLRTSCKEVEFTKCHYYTKKFGDNGHIAWAEPTAEVTAKMYWVNNKKGELAVIGTPRQSPGPRAPPSWAGNNGWFCNFKTQSDNVNWTKRNECRLCRRI